MEIKKLLDNLFEIKKASYKLENNNCIKFRYEFNNYNKEQKKYYCQNVFMYFNNYKEFLTLYKKIPDENKHFYEIMENNCKFFLDLDVKLNEMSWVDWTNNTELIKNELILFFKNKFNMNINIIKYNCKPTIDEPKYSCHIVVPQYYFRVNDCKIICNMFLELLEENNPKLIKMIDNMVYGYNRMLRIEKSTKINSNRRKICINDNDEKNYINLKGLIANLNEAEYMDLTSFLELDKIKNEQNKNNSPDKKNDKNINLKIIQKENNKKYMYTEEDVIYTKKNHENIISIVNKWHYNFINHENKNDIFVLLKIENNRIDLKRKKSFNCPLCKRIHENQHPYVFISNGNIMFNCRRYDNPIKIEL